MDAIRKETLDEVCQEFMNLAGRKMTASEIAQARLIYGNTFDYDTVYFSKEGSINDTAFSIQDFFTGNDNSRAFVTAKLVNHDVNDGPLTNRTMIHELCHVWQYQEAGPVYLIQAIHAQTLGAGYSYGYTNSIDGTGGEDDLQNAISNNPDKPDAEVFEIFNREQQAQIIMHYYQRRYVEKPPLDYSAWQPFQEVVYSA